jgi:hypothetical protein
MPRTVGAGLEIISSPGSIVARSSCHNRPRMATFHMHCEVAGKVARIETQAGARVEGQHVATLRA